MANPLFWGRVREGMIRNRSIGRQTGGEVGEREGRGGMCFMSIYSKRPDSVRYSHERVHDK